MKLAQAITLSSLLFGVSCVVKTPAGNITPVAPKPTIGAPSGSTPGTAGPDVAPGCDYPENHCLPADVVLVADKPYKERHVYLSPARQTGQPGPSGEATYLATNSGKELVSKFVYVSRPATAADIQIGRIALMLNHPKSGFYGAPKDTKEALGQKWWMSRITDTAGAAQGYVKVNSNYKVRIEAIRVFDEDKSPIATVTPTEDAQYLSPEHWIVSDKPLPVSRFSYASVGTPIQAPSAATKNEGHFVQADTGRILWTPHAWRTRPAAAADLKVGVYVFMPHHTSNGVYQKAKDRVNTIGRKWWISKVVDNSEAFKGVVQVAGGYKVAVDSIRVQY